jgi:hypothetical protein
MPFAPLKPTAHHAPTQIAPGTWVIHQVQQATGLPLNVYMNSLVIQGAEPIIVDTGTPSNREQWLEDVFSIVEPNDVRWIFISHDDVDHMGNVDHVLEACPNATMVCNWFMVERHTCAVDMPLHRMRWVDHGGSFQAGDRTMHVLRPPFFDSPVTRGLFDDKTGVYWAVDSFAAPMPEVVPTVSDLDPAGWQDGMVIFGHALCPWLTLTDPGAFGATIDAVEQLRPTTIAGAHTPTIPSSKIDEAFRNMRNIHSSIPAMPMPDQGLLEAMLAAAGHGAAAPAGA